MKIRAFLFVVGLMSILSACGGDKPVPGSSSSSSSSASSSSSNSSSSGSSPSSILLEEGQNTLCGGSYTVDSNNTGFTGTGFINTPNAAGESVTWNVQSSQSSQYTLEFRFANGGASPRSGELRVNGGSNGSFTVDFASTGTWTNWQNETLIVDLVQGANTLTLTSTGPEGLANLDYLKVSGSGLSAGVCSGSSSSSSSSSSSGTPGGSSADCNELQGYTQVTVGNGGQYSKVQDAINSVSKNNSKLVIIKIKPGTYKERIEVDRPHIMLCGEKGKASSTKLTFDDYARSGHSTSQTYSMQITANDVSGENITIENSYGKGSQAVALLVKSDRVQFRNSRFLGYQDTLYVFDGTQYYRNCYIEGRTDYIFGRGTGVFHNSTIHHIDNGGALTAPKTLKSNKYGLIFIDSKVTAKSGVSGAILGRNWGADGSTVFLRTELGSHIKRDAWAAMGSNSLSTARFYEYKSSGPGANPSARSSRQLSDNQAADFTIDKIFGNWTPSFSL